MRVLLLALAAAGCHGGETAMPTLDAPLEPADAAAVFPAPHPREPQLTSYGEVMPAPVIVPITFADDPYAADFVAFSAKLGATAYWHEIANAYGIGAITSASPIRVATVAPATITQATVRSWIASQLDGTHAEWGTPDPTKIYSVFYPKTTALALDGIGRACVDFVGGYHDDVAVGSTRVTFSVIIECDSGLDGTTMLDASTLNFSHELIEAATDPHGLGWYVEPAGYAVLAFADSGEIADMCEFTSVRTTPADLGYTVTRAWSNAAALAGHQPCVPAMAEPYFNTAPVMSDPVTFQVLGYTLATTGVHVPVGGSATIALELFSDAPTSGPWQVSALDAERLKGAPAKLGFTFDRSSGSNGDVLHLTIDVLSADTSFAAEPFVIVSQLGTTTRTWFGIVGN
ncbi:MAG: hypothetical protein ABJE66_05025 [Deltaproteobacteria bacterium]